MPNRLATSQQAISIAMSQPWTPKLSLCIPTFNRATFLRSALDNLIAQSTDECEIVVSDNASSDSTKKILSEYALRHPRLRYVCQPKNIGFDRNLDQAVALSCGEYCWLVPDDDQLKPGAISRVLSLIRGGVSLIVVNTEYRNFDMTKIVKSRALDIRSDAVYAPHEMDRLFVDVSGLITFIGCVIIKREIWVVRNKERYHGSNWVQVGVIFQEKLPSDAVVVADPLIIYRCGNTHAPEVVRGLYEAVSVRYPTLLQSLALSDTVKRSTYKIDAWSNLKRCLLWRALGYYSLSEYRSCIQSCAMSRWKKLPFALVALVPGILVNTAFVIAYALVGSRNRGLSLQLLRESRFHPLNVLAHRPSQSLR